MSDDIPRDTDDFADEAVAPLPTMTRQEATFHASVAGVRAAKEAEALGCDPDHARALGIASLGGVEIGGLHLELPSAYSALAVPAIAALLDRCGVAISGLQSDCLLVAAFHKPRDTYRLAIAQADEAAARELVALANDVALTLLHRERIDEAVAWCTDAFQRLNGVKKPSAQTTARPDPAPAPETAATPCAASPNRAAGAPAGSAPSSTR